MSNSLFRVRKFKNGDGPFCLHVVSEAIGDLDARKSFKHFKAYEAGRVRPGEWLYIAETFNQEKLGVCGIFPVSCGDLIGRDADYICGVHWFAVNPKWQRKGVGSELLRYSEGMARVMEFRFIFTQSDDRAIGFYRGRGYQSVENFLSRPMPYTTLLEKRLE